MYRKSSEVALSAGPLAAYGVIWLALANDPVFRKDWLLENAIVFVAIPLFVLTARRLALQRFRLHLPLPVLRVPRDRRALHVLARALRRMVAVDRRR